MDSYNQPSTFRRVGIFILLIVIIFAIIIEDWKILMAVAITALQFLIKGSLLSIAMCLGLMHLINKKNNSYVIAASVATLFTFAIMAAVSNMVTTTPAATTTTIPPTLLLE